MLADTPERIDELLAIAAPLARQPPRKLVPTRFVRRSLRPGAVAPNETLTRFSWTLGPQRVAPAD